MQRCAAALLACVMSAGAQEIRTTQIASGIAAPTDIQDPKDGSGRLFFVQQNGVVRIFRGGAVSSRPFLDISGKTRADGERGLLGLAFPPGFAQKQRFYVDYTDLNGDTTIARYQVSTDREAADGASEVVLLKIAQPFANHNGGQIRFGGDGYLYIGMGDGGSAGDPMGNGQNLGALLGKMLRIDVESDPGNVRIPPDNPFVNAAGARPEIWAYGLRNPWRYSFDRASGDLWIADVGQDAYEEVDFQAASSRGGENYGWNRMEGMHCYPANCSMQGLTLPVAEYPHSQGCSVSGGFVYRGRSSPGLRGIYLYGDYCSGRIWGTERQGTTWLTRQLLASNFGITTFGEDEAGEVYVANATDGTIHHIEGSLAPRLTTDGVTNAASFDRGLTAGSLATIFVAGILDDPGVMNAGGIPAPTSLGGVSVAVNGVNAPVLLIANVKGQEQINFQAPFEIRGQSTVKVMVRRNNQSSAAVDVPVLSVQPAIYTIQGGAAVVHNVDFSLVTAAQPLVPGEFAFFYATGLGQVKNEPATGAGAPLGSLATLIADVGVTLGGQTCDVQYAGLAPGLVGVYQVNFRVPQNAASGAQSLAIAVAGATSPAAKIAIR
uniref:Glucose/sorbosone dehydrogenase-like protein n=1 Tax=Solibacter usitatus (strain Ellin6076) TaxID=234267 RepID=Q024X4_SOLUE